MATHIRRRELVFALGGAAAAWPLGARTQQPALPTIGFLSGASSAKYQPFVTAFKEGLKQPDYVEGRNVAIKYRWAEGQFDRLPKLAADLVVDQPTVIMASGNAAAVAAKTATATIPIVFTSGFDPIQIGLVASFNRPEGNITGVYTLRLRRRLRLLSCCTSWSLPLQTSAYSSTQRVPIFPSRS